MFRPPAAERCRGRSSGVGHPVSPAGSCQWKRQDLLRSWGTPIVLLPCSPTPAGPTHQAMRCAGAAPAVSTTKAPAFVLSRLNHTASALAVYASQAGSPRHHARLASGCWPDSSGRAWLPAGFQRKVSRLYPTSHPPFPSSTQCKDTYVIIAGVPGVPGIPGGVPARVAPGGFPPGAPTDPNVRN